MSAERDVTRIVRSWLHEDAHEDAERVLSLVLEELDTTPQRRAGWLARRSHLMSNTVRIVAAAAAVLVVVFVGIRLFGGTNTGGPGPSPSQSEAPSLQPSPTPSATPPAIPAAGPLAIGRHSLTLAGVPASLELSNSGWTSNGDFGFDRGSETSPTFGAFIFWLKSAADNTYSDPCTETQLAPPAGPSIADRAAAVAAVPGVEVVSAPSQVTVGGHPAQRVVIRIPSTIGCAPNSFYLWYDADDPSGELGRYATAVGSTIYTWIVDVDGTIVWIDGETSVASDSQAAPELQAIVDSIRFK